MPARAKAEAAASLPRFAIRRRGVARYRCRCLSQHDEPLSAGIARWQQVLATSQPTFSAYYSLAQLAEQRDELPLAAAVTSRRFSCCRSADRYCSNWLGFGSAGRFRRMMARDRSLARTEPRASELRASDCPNAILCVRNSARRGARPFQRSAAQGTGYCCCAFGRRPRIGDGAEKEFAAMSPTMMRYRKTNLCEASWTAYLGDHLQDRAMPLLNRVLAHGDEATANRVRMALICQRYW